MHAWKHVEKSVRVSGKECKLSDFRTRIEMPVSKDKNSLMELGARDMEEISILQNKLYAENCRSLLIIFQGMDSAGKDGTIKHIMKGVNPQGVLVTSFKHPSDVELKHDYLWRHVVKLPEHGQIAIFNRSHYENVLISKVHPELVLAERLYGYNTIEKIDKTFWKLCYNQINHFEKSNMETGTRILKFFLHLSEKEQGRRFLDRIANPEKHWKFSSGDMEERKYWAAYQDAYEQAIKYTGTKSSPWFIIPADDKPYAHVLVGKILLTTLRNMNLDFPPKTKQELTYMQKEKGRLENELKQESR